MDKSGTDMSQYLGIFLDEGNEQLSLLEADILKMERGDHSQEILQSMFRAAHTLKGSSRAMGFMEIGNLTHEMENVLDDLRNDKLNVSTAIVDALLDCLDALSALMAAVGATGKDTNSGRSDIADLVKRLELLKQGQEDAALAQSAGDGDPGEHAALEITFSPEHLEAAAQFEASHTPVYRIDVTVEEACFMKPVRAVMAIASLEGVGTLIGNYPPDSEIESDSFDGRFTMLFASQHPEAEIAEVIGKVSEIGAVEIHVFEAKASAKPAKKSAKKEEPATAKVEVAPAQAAVEAPSAAKAEAPPTEAAVATIRVGVNRLDSLLNLVGELVTDRTQIQRLAADIQQRHGNDESIIQLSEALGRVGLITSELQEEVMKTRMLPIDGVFQRMPRMMRDLARKTGKEIDFQMSGGETELDRSVLEVLGDPLIHILRNSVDHAIEPPEEREAVGKPKLGHVGMCARYEESHIVIDITDDGRGIDPVKIKAKAIEKGILTETAAALMSDREAINLVMASGFSTAAVVSDISGRGVGMDIVKNSLEKIGGRLLIDSKVGVGTKISISLPITLAIVRALLVIANHQTYIIPLSSVVEMLRLGENNTDITETTVGGQAVIVVRGQTIPLIGLTGMLQDDQRSTSRNHIGEDAHVVVVGHEGRHVGICVDSVAGEQEVVIKGLGSLLGEIPGISGASILGDGRVALIVDVAKAIDEIKDARRHTDKEEERGEIVAA
jgi:two-component system, chemotaxis family, sensor kinase CheA